MMISRIAENPKRQRLGEEVREVVCAVCERHRNITGLDAFTYEEVTSFDRAWSVDGARGCRLPDLWPTCGFSRRQAEVGEQGAEVDRLFGSQGGSDHLGFT
eukprot:303099-Pleurochrysis_carterae.AAC.5